MELSTKTMCFVILMDEYYYIVLLSLDGLEIVENIIYRVGVCYKILLILFIVYQGSISILSLWQMNILQVWEGYICMCVYVCACTGVCAC